MVDEGLPIAYEVLERGVLVYAADAGRGSIPVTVVGMKPDAARIERVEQGGVHRVVFWLPAQGRDEAEAAFESFAAVARDYAGAS